MVEVYMMPAAQGDFIWVRYGVQGDMHNIVIDGGMPVVGTSVKNTLEHIFDGKEEKVDALFLSHIDNDHIGGLLTGMQMVEPSKLKENIEKVYVNTGRGINEALKMGIDMEKGTFVEDTIEEAENDNNYGVGEAISWMKLLEKTGMKDKLVECTMMGEVLEIGGAKLHVISPGEKNLRDLVEKKWEPYKADHNISGVYGAGIPAYCAINLDDLMEEKFKSDSSYNNKSSIAFVFEYEDVKIAFLGDAAASVCVQGLKKCGFTKLPVDALKLAHHGSNHNTSKTLLEAFPTNTYLLSTNGSIPNGTMSVPHKVTLAKLIQFHPDENVNLLCNYDWSEKAYSGFYFTDEDEEKYLDKGKLNYHLLEREEYNIKEGLTIYGKWN